MLRAIAKSSTYINKNYSQQSIDNPNFKYKTKAKHIYGIKGMSKSKTNNNYGIKESSKTNSENKYHKKNKTGGEMPVSTTKVGEINKNYNTGGEMPVSTPKVGGINKYYNSGGEKPESTPKVGGVKKNNKTGGDKPDNTHNICVDKKNYTSGGEIPGRSSILGGDKNQKNYNLGGERPKGSYTLGGDKYIKKNILGGDKPNRPQILSGDKSKYKRLKYNKMIKNTKTQNSHHLGGDMPITATHNNMEIARNVKLKVNDMKLVGNIDEITNNKEVKRTECMVKISITEDKSISSTNKKYTPIMKNNKYLDGNQLTEQEFNKTSKSLSKSLTRTEQELKTHDSSNHDSSNHDNSNHKTVKISNNSKHSNLNNKTKKSYNKKSYATKFKINDKYKSNSKDSNSDIKLYDDISKDDTSKDTIVPGYEIKTVNIGYSSNKLPVNKSTVNNLPVNKITVNNPPVSKTTVYHQPVNESNIVIQPVNKTTVNHPLVKSAVNHHSFINEIDNSLSANTINVKNISVISNVNHLSVKPAVSHLPVNSTVNNQPIVKEIANHLSITENTVSNKSVNSTVNSPVTKQTVKYLPDILQTVNYQTVKPTVHHQPVIKPTVNNQQFKSNIDNEPVHQSNIYIQPVNLLTVNNQLITNQFVEDHQNVSQGNQIYESENYYNYQYKENQIDEYEANRNLNNVDDQGTLSSNDDDNIMVVYSGTKFPISLEKDGRIEFKSQNSKLNTIIKSIHDNHEQHSNIKKTMKKNYNNLLTYNPWNQNQNLNQDITFQHPINQVNSKKIESKFKFANILTQKVKKLYHKIHKELNFNKMQKLNIYTTTCI